MKFSIVVPTLNEQKYIGTVLKGLKAQTFKDFEVIIVDADSEDKTLEVIEQNKGDLDIRVVQPHQRGVSFQRNYGASLARYDDLIFFDADTFVEKDFLQKIAEYLKKHEVDTLTAWNIPISNRKIDHMVAYMFNRLYLEGVKNSKPAAIGTFIYFRKKPFETLKGFDSANIIGEDAELVMRAAQNGYTYALLREPVVYFSTRRADKEGRLHFVIRNIMLGFYYHLRGPMKNPKIFKYEFGKHI